MSNLCRHLLISVASYLIIAPRRTGQIGLCSSRLRVPYLCWVLHLPRLGLLGLQVKLTIGLPPVLHLVGRTILPRVGRKNTPLPTTSRLCPRCASYVASLLHLLKARSSVAFALAKTRTTSSTSHIASLWVMRLQTS